MSQDFPVNRHAEKNDNLLKKLGQNLKAQRENVFKEDHESFAMRMGLFGAKNFTSSILRDMESGSHETKISHWMAAWLIMQVADNVAASTKSDAALFLAATELPSSIEAEIAKELNKRTDK